MASGSGSQRALADRTKRESVLVDTVGKQTVLSDRNLTEEFLKKFPADHYIISANGKYGKSGPEYDQGNRTGAWKRRIHDAFHQQSREHFATADETVGGQAIRIRLPQGDGALDRGRSRLINLALSSSITDRRRHGFGSSWAVCRQNISDDLRLSLREYLAHRV